jgi:hypothetical protein
VLPAKAALFPSSFPPNPAASPPPPAMNTPCTDARPIPRAPVDFGWLGNSFVLTAVPSPPPLSIACRQESFSAVAWQPPDQPWPGGPALFLARLQARTQALTTPSSNISSRWGGHCRGQPRRVTCSSCALHPCCCPCGREPHHGVCQDARCKTGETKGERGRQLQTKRGCGCELHDDVCQDARCQSMCATRAVRVKAGAGDRAASRG